jgi:hypothetical protein
VEKFLPRPGARELPIFHSSSGSGLETREAFFIRLSDSVYIQISCHVFVNFWKLCGHPTQHTHGFFGASAITRFVSLVRKQPAATHSVTWVATLIDGLIPIEYAAVLLYICLLLRNLGVSLLQPSRTVRRVKSRFILVF